MNIKYCILLFSLISNFSIAQNGNLVKKEVKQIISLGKLAIIELALKQLDKEVDTSYFKSIKVMASDDEVYVSFHNSIKFIPENSAYFYDATVFINGTKFCDPFKNPDNIEYNIDEVQFFKYDDEVLEKIKFVIKAISKQEIVDTIDWKYYEDNNGMIIYDKGDYYDVNKSYGEFNEAAYTVDKSTGVATEEYHADIIPDPYVSKVRYVEIKN